MHSCYLGIHFILLRAIKTEIARIWIQNDFITILHVVTLHIRGNLIGWLLGWEIAFSPERQEYTFFYLFSILK
jgi:hypothetical protein